MDASEISWLPVFGYGGHIKATTKELTIVRGSVTQHYPLSEIRHLLVVGGHTLHMSAVVNLVKSGSAISFFDIDGTPLGFLKPYGYHADEDVHAAQYRAGPHRYAVTVALAALQSRLLQIARLSDAAERQYLYEGELILLHQARGELEHMVTMDEIRRLHRLTTDMYYEILGRTIPPELGYRRRTARPHDDPVNAMLSLGYAMLYGNCCVAAIGAHLDPDCGMLQEGEGGLVHDIIEPMKAEMVDKIVFSVARDTLLPKDYDCSSKRCYLSEELTGLLVGMLRSSIDQSRLDAQVELFRDALMHNREYYVLY